VREVGTPPASAADLYLAGLCNDVGKSAVEEVVLKKSGR